MKTKCGETEVEITERFQAALVELMEAECEMMRAAEPEFADCWVEGSCTIGNLETGSGLSFCFGAQGDVNAEAEEPFTVFVEREIDAT